MRYRVLLALAVIPLSLLACSSLSEHEDPIRLAEQQTEQGHYEEALVIYQEHMEDRLAQTNRPEWENPYFYLLAVGDIYLRMGQPERALASYNEAEKHGVEASLISDRYRSVAHWYIEQRQLEQALEVLRKYRDRDSLLFDSLLDKVGRALTAQESARSGAAQKHSIPTR